MVKVTLKTISEFKGTFDITNDSEKRGCIIKILDLCVQGYRDDFRSHHELSHISHSPYEFVEQYFSGASTIETIESNSRYISVFTNISTVLGLLSRDTTFVFTRPPYNNGNAHPVGNAHASIGGLHKEYINLQKGGKRLVRYGSRGGRYYMKGGKKVYIK